MKSISINTKFLKATNSNGDVVKCRTELTLDDKLKNSKQYGKYNVKRSTSTFNTFVCAFDCKVEEISYDEYKTISNSKWLNIAKEMTKTKIIQALSHK